MTCADCVHYKSIGYTYGNCELMDNHAVKFDESCERENAGVTSTRPGPAWEWKVSIKRWNELNRTALEKGGVTRISRPRVEWLEDVPKESA